VPLKIDRWSPSGAAEVETAAVVALFRQGLAAQTPPDVRTAVSARALLQSWLEAPKTGVLLARGIGDKIEGILVLRSEPPAARVVFVAAREPRKGTGTALVSALRGIASTKGAKELRVVYSQQDARARAFYRKLGFVDDREAGATREGAPLMEGRLPIAMS
jgi:GNAT superfamily N-acetyltransferase